MDAVPLKEPQNLDSGVWNPSRFLLLVRPQRILQRPTNSGKHGGCGEFELFIDRGVGES